MTGGIPRSALLILALAALVANLPALFPGFIHDDHRIIEQNELVRDPSRAGEILTSGYWTVGDTPVPNLYRPLTILSFSLNYAIGGDSAVGYRLVNLALHLAATLLVLGLGLLLIPPKRPGESGWEPAFIAALLFAVHPVHTEVLGEVVGRAELLAAVGTLVCVVAFLRARLSDGGRPGLWYAVSIAAFVGGFLSKENAVVAPFLVLAADLLVTRRRPLWSFHAAAGAALALVLALRVAALGSLNPDGLVHFIDNPIAHMGPIEGRLTAIGVLALYAMLLVAPLRLSVDYSYDAIPAAAGIFDPRVLAGVVILAAGTVGFIHFRRRRPTVALAVAWLGLAMAPTANLLLPIGTIMAERLLYLPSVGFCLLVAALLYRVDLGPGERHGAWVGGVRVVMAMVILAFAVRGAVRLLDWRDDRTLFRAAIEVVPDSVRARYNYGTASEEAGDDAEAQRAYEHAIRIWPEFSDAQYNLAGIYARQGRFEAAVRHYRAALAEQPGNVSYLVNLGQSLGALGRRQEAVTVLRRALDLDPRSDRAWTILGSAYLARGAATAAIAAYREALQIDPRNADYFRNLGLALVEAGEPEAAAAFTSGLSIRPDDPELLVGLGLLHLREGRPEDAVPRLTRAVELQPRQPMYSFQLGRALEGTGRPARAAAAYREAIRLAPEVPLPHCSLGRLLGRRGEADGAVAALETCARLDPGGRVMDDETSMMLRRMAGSAPE